MREEQARKRLIRFIILQTLLIVALSINFWTVSASLSNIPYLIFKIVCILLVLFLVSLHIFDLIRNSKSILNGRITKVSGNKISVESNTQQIRRFRISFEDAYKLQAGMEVELCYYTRTKLVVYAVQGSIHAADKCYGESDSKIV